MSHRCLLTFLLNYAMLTIRRRPELRSGLNLRHEILSATPGTRP